MRRAYLVILLNISMAASTVAAANTVVSFIHPDDYTDLALYGGCCLGAKQPALTGIAEYLEGLGAHDLAPSQTLTVEVTDIDLAGELEPWRPLGYDTRVMRDVYPPRIRLRYRLTGDGLTAMEGEETIVDLNYLANPATRQVQGPLRYEKAMLSHWFRSRLMDRRPAPGNT